MGNLRSKPFEHWPAHKLKLVILGPAGSGKSCVACRCIDDTFFTDSVPTDKASIHNVHWQLKAKIDVFLELWDLPGENVVDLDDRYFEGADAAIIVLDVNMPETDCIAAVDECVTRLQRAASARGAALSGSSKKDIATVVWFNKIDTLHPAPDSYPNIRKEIPDYNDALSPLFDRLNILRNFLVGIVHQRSLLGSAIVSARRPPEPDLHADGSAPGGKIAGAPLWDSIRDAGEQLLLTILGVHTGAAATSSPLIPTQHRFSTISVGLPRSLPSTPPMPKFDMPPLPRGSLASVGKLPSSRPRSKDDDSTANASESFRLPSMGRRLTSRTTPRAAPELQLRDTPEMDLPAAPTITRSQSAMVGRQGSLARPPAITTEPATPQRFASVRAAPTTPAVTPSVVAMNFPPSPSPSLVQ
eukprot:TRINITY_DN4075_c0_g1_i1.p1 TRINITY_DN4075_c0_g1~~TRINITY_DN4075_c0_g1_i1.p1  ORF type:complete len:414 (+),score=59.10 TRINITY_DN4075_c0_g1_i1:77-1318(+)